MPKTATKLNWLDSLDKNGHKISQWAIKKSYSEAYCTFCKIPIDVENGGIYQLQRLSKGGKHTKLTVQTLSRSQTKFHVGLGGVYLPHTGSSSTAKWSLTHKEKVTKAEAIWAMKVAKDKYAYKSCRDIPAYV